MNAITKTILVALLVCTTSAHANLIDDSLVKMEDEANKQLPLTVKQDNNEIRLDSIIPGPGLRFTYMYTLIM